MKILASPCLRSPALLLLSTGTAVLIAGLTGPLRHAAPVGFDDLLAAGAAWLLLGACLWGVVICGAATVEALSAGRLRATTWVPCPRALRRVLLAGLGVALVATPAAATPTARDPAPGTGSPSGGLRAPARPAGGVLETRHHVVRTGEALWRIAQRRLPRAAQPPQVADLVERLHRRNRGLIGPDPDLIRPGQRLVVPALPQEPDHHREETR